MEEIWNASRSSEYIIHSAYGLTNEALNLFDLCVRCVASKTYIESRDGTLYIVIFKKKNLCELLGIDPATKKERLNYIARQLSGTCIRYLGGPFAKYGYIPVIKMAAYSSGTFIVSLDKAGCSVLFTDECFVNKLRLFRHLRFRSKYAQLLYDKVAYASCLNNLAGIRTGLFSLNYSVEEIKIILQVLNVGEERVAAALFDSTVPDYELASRVARDNKYVIYSELERNVIQPAVNEINSYSICRVEVVRKNKSHNKTSGIIINVYIDDKFSTR